MRTRNSKIIKQVAEFFIEKGKILSTKEYQLCEDAPIRYQVLRRYVTVWSRIDKIIKTSFPDLYAKIGQPEAPKDEVVKKTFSSTYASKKGKVNEE